MSNAKRDSHQLLEKSTPKTDVESVVFNLEQSYITQMWKDHSYMKINRKQKAAEKITALKNTPDIFFFVFEMIDFIAENVRNLENISNCFFFQQLSY